MGRIFRFLTVCDLIAFDGHYWRRRGGAGARSPFLRTR
jgi:hypothetical protein